MRLATCALILFLTACGGDQKPASAGKSPVPPVDSSGGTLAAKTTPAAAADTARELTVRLDTTKTKTGRATADLGPPGAAVSEGARYFAGSTLIANASV